MAPHYLRAYWNAVTNQPLIRVHKDQILIIHVEQKVKEFIASLGPEVVAKECFLFTLKWPPRRPGCYPLIKWSVLDVSRIYSKQAELRRNKGENVIFPELGPCQWTVDGEPCFVDDDQEVEDWIDSIGGRVWVARPCDSLPLIVWTKPRPRELTYPLVSEVNDLQIQVGYPFPGGKRAASALTYRIKNKPGEAAQQSPARHKKQLCLVKNVDGSSDTYTEFHATPAAAQVLGEFERVQLSRSKKSKSLSGIHRDKRRLQVAILLNEKQEAIQVWGEPRRLSLHPIEIGNCAMASSEHAGLVRASAVLCEFHMTLDVLLFPEEKLVEVWQAVCVPKDQLSKSATPASAITCLGAFKGAVFCVWHVYMEHGLVGIGNRWKLYRALPYAQAKKNGLKWTVATLSVFREKVTSQASWTHGHRVRFDWVNHWKKPRTLTDESISIFRPNAGTMSRSEIKLSQVVKRIIENQRTFEVGLVYLPMAAEDQPHFRIKHAHGLTVFAVIDHLRKVEVTGNALISCVVSKPSELEGRAIKYSLGSVSARRQLNAQFRKNTSPSGYRLTVALSYLKVILLRYDGVANAEKEKSKAMDDSKPVSRAMASMKWRDKA